jgi:cob(I)alamin adenosyltransferase
MNIIQSMKKIFTGTGDKGYTGLLGDERVPKHHPQPEAYGALDEVSAALGMARALCDSARVIAILKEIQHDLYDAMTELAATAENRSKFKQLDLERVEWLETVIQEFSQKIEIPDKFVTSGETLEGAVFDQARTIVRRAERAVTKLHFGGKIKYDVILQYLNRLSSLCFALSLWGNQKER